MIGIERDATMQSPSSLWSLLGDPLLQWIAPIFLLALATEALWSRHHGLGRYQRDDTLVSLAMLGASALVDLLPKLVAVWLMLHIAAASPLADAVGRQWWAWLLLFLLDDFCYYWFHRLNHRVRLFWAGHVNHHSSRCFNYATALRAGVGERLHKYLYWLWLPLLGFDVPMILAMVSLNLFYQFWLHSSAIHRLPAIIEWIFNTPSHHRVHHGSNVRYLDRNHGGVLIVWDRIFGTFEAELDTEPARYGLTRNLQDTDPWTVMTHEYRALWQDLRRAPNWQSRWAYLSRAPGWSHDGRDERAAVLRRSAGLS